jgi:acyl-CoA reductase-like NAD-dependent aldehyde dehydrogenase
MTTTLNPSKSGSVRDEKAEFQPVSLFTANNLPEVFVPWPLSSRDTVVSPLLNGESWMLNNPASFTVQSPADGRVLARVAQLGKADLDTIVQAAQAGFESYRRSTWESRANILRNLALLLEAHQKPLQELISLEVGKPVKFAAIEVQRAIALARLYSEKVDTLSQQEAQQPIPMGNHQAYQFLRPLGPVLAYTPFNFPLNLVLHKLAPAIGAGTSIVIKPTPRAPLTALYLAQLAVAAGYTAITIVNLGNEEAAALVQNPVFRVFSFTGGNIGWDLARQTPVNTVKILELGSNAALIVEDLPADDQAVERVAQKAASSAFGFAGQSCISTQRILVNRSLYPRFMAAFETALGGIKQGDIQDPTTDLGPMISPEAAQKVMAHVQAALDAGATRLEGKTNAEHLFSGNWLKPTALLETRPEMAVNREELFAPVVTITPYDTFEEGLSLANATQLGLQAGIYTQSTEKAELAQQTLWVRGLNINDVPSARDDRLPYGGVGHSGMGVEGVHSGIEDYSEVIYRLSAREV